MTKVLVIEDDPRIRSNIAEILSYENYEVVEAENGVVGVQIAIETLPDLIICDVMMPEMDGYTTFLNLRNEISTATIPFIFLTARVDRESMRYGMELGADDYLTKPFTTTDLLGAVTARLQKQALLASKYEQKLDNLRDELINTLPHELRTPLTGIIGYSELLMTSDDTLQHSQVVSMATMIHTSGLRLHRLAENYLFYAQIEILRSDPNRVLAFTTHVLEDVDEVITTVALKKAHDFGRANDLVLDVQHARAQISEDNLQKIMFELVDNAFKFSPSGTQVIVTASQEADHLVIRITDHGRGMTPNQIRDIGAYMQFERKLYEQQGSGLGLIISKRLVELYRGELVIDSVVGQTTTVSVSIPLA